VIPKDVQDWACSLSGCDGGNIEANIWLCGLEWGAGSFNEGIYYKEQLVEEIKTGRVEYRHSLFDWEKSITFNFGWNFAKLYTAMQGEKDVSKYKELASTWNGSDLFKLNLYPIAFDSDHESLWRKNDLNTITGFDEKRDYQLWCSLNRFPFFSNLRSENPPKLIICVGIGYRREFFLAFGGNKGKNSLINEEQIEAASDKNKRTKRRYFWINVDRTTIVVIPFFSIQPGLNSDHLLRRMGQEILNLRPDVFD